ncbi:MAG: MCE family protein [Candidatus Omnitrophica bacterium]|nr:MCE family protein [Candidatus Omnitrophota bacterium]
MGLKFKNEIKVGIFSLVGVIIFVVFVFSIGDIKLFTKSKDVKIVFGFANGVKISSPVRLAGVDVGQVRKISVRFNRQTQKNEVEVLARVTDSTIIPQDSKVWINTLGLLGEKYIEIIPGLDYAHLFKPGETIIGKDPIPMQEITELGREIALKLRESIDAINNFILNEKNKEAYNQVLENLEEASKSLSEIMEKINSGDGTAGKFISDEAIYTDTKEFIEDIKKHPWKLMRKPQEE